MTELRFVLWQQREPAVGGSRCAGANAISFPSRNPENCSKGSRPCPVIMAKSLVELECPHAREIGWYRGINDYIVPEADGFGDFFYFDFPEERT